MLVSWLIAATTHYTITDKRVIMQIGVALPIALTLPLKRIGSADVKLNADGTGDIPLALGRQKLAYLLALAARAAVALRPGRSRCCARCPTRRHVATACRAPCSPRRRPARRSPLSEPMRARSRSRSRRNRHRHRLIKEKRETHRSI